MRRSGFTLIELLLVIGIIAILASIVIVAINPTRQLNSARDAQRRADVNTIVNAVYQYAIDNNALPSTITTTQTDICRGTDTDAQMTSDGCINLRMLTGTYVVNIPSDPSQLSTSLNTNYGIVKNSNNRVTVTATGELTTSISVTR